MIDRREGSAPCERTCKQWPRARPHIRPDRRRARTAPRRCRGRVQPHRRVQRRRIRDRDHPPRPRADRPPGHVTDSDARPAQQPGGDFIAYAISFAVLGRYWLSPSSLLLGARSVRRDADDAEPRLPRVHRAGAVQLAGAGRLQRPHRGRGPLRDQPDPRQRQLLRADRPTASVPGSFGTTRGATSGGTAGPTALFVVGVFVISIPVAFVSPLAATLMWLAIFFVGGAGVRPDRGASVFLRPTSSRRSGGRGSARARQGGSAGEARPPAGGVARRSDSARSGGTGVGLPSSSTATIVR